MSRFSPQVVPRRKSTLADALMEGVEGYAEGRRYQDARAEAQGNRDREFDFRQDEAEFRRTQSEQQTGRQRAADASEGLMYDPEGTYGQTPELEFQLPTSQGMPVSPVSRIPAGRRSDVRDLGGGYTLDPTLTREGRAATMERAQSARLAEALEAGGIDPGVARAGAALPSALPFLLPRERTDPAPEWQRQGYPSFAMWRNDQLRGRGGAARLGGGGPSDPFAGDPDFEGGASGLSVLDASRIVGDFDKETDQQLDLARALAPTDPTDRSMSLRRGGADSANVVRADSLRGVAGERIAHRPTVPGLLAPSRTRMRGVQSGGTSGTAPAPAAASNEDAADRWDELVEGGMAPDQATAQVKREFGLP